MKNVILKNLHWFIIAYALNGLFTIYEEKNEQIENVKQVIPSLQAKIQKAKKDIKNVKEFEKDLVQSKEKVLEVQKQIEKVQKQLPTDVNDTQVQELIGKIAKNLRIKDPSPTPGIEQNNGFYFTKEYNFTGIGTYLQHLIFFENLEKAERILNVKNVDMKVDQSSLASRFPIVKLSAAVESYRYNKSYREKSYVKEIEQKYKVD